MMKVLPSHTETLVMVHDGQEVLDRLTAATSVKTLVQPTEPGKVFIGWIKEDQFSISLKIKRPDSFIPLIDGFIEPSSKGSLLFLKYRLFPVIRIYLLFWTIFTLIAGTVASYQYQSVLFACGTLALPGIIHWIAWANFKRQVKRSREELLQILN